jgi:hypothetical protein
MQPRHLLLALPITLVLSPIARADSATPPDQQKPGTPAGDATSVVEKQLVKPLARKEAHQNRFSRVYIPPQARRVRVVDRQPSTDSRGAQFVAFAVDERSALAVPLAHGDAVRWREDAIVGCVYPARDEVFIRRGDKFFAAGLLLGQRTPAPDAAVCHPVAPGK